MKKSPQSGFTLLEVMVALTIFSLLSFAAWQLLSVALKSNTQNKAYTQRFSHLQRAVSIFSNDAIQAIPRRSRSTGQALFAAENSLIFTTQNWSNTFNGCCTPDIQTVHWYLQDGTLYRAVRTSPDTDDEPYQVALLNNVSAFSLRTFSGGVWNEAISSSNLPDAIELSLTLTDYGTVRRVYLFPAPWPAFDNSEPQTEASKS